MPAALLEATVTTSLSFMSRFINRDGPGRDQARGPRQGSTSRHDDFKTEGRGAVAFSGCGIAFGAAALGIPGATGGSSTAGAASKASAEPENRKVTRKPEAPQAKASAGPEGQDDISFRKLALSTDDLVDATGLDIYKFRIDVAKGEQFRVVLRSQESKESPAREIVSHLVREDFGRVRRSSV